MGSLRDAIDAIDSANSADPNFDDGPDGPEVKELLYSARMTSALQRVYPRASDLLQIAARGQHVERWRIPRSQYPVGRVGYLKWRKQLAEHHARRLGELMAGAGYDEDSIARVQTMVRKQGIKTDHEVQALEDTACLVFLEHYLHRFRLEHPEEKVIAIISKTWDKMSARARAAATALPIGKEESLLIQHAISP